LSSLQKDGFFVLEFLSIVVIHRERFAMELDFAEIDALIGAVDDEVDLGLLFPLSGVDPYHKWSKI